MNRYYKQTLFGDVLNRQVLVWVENQDTNHSVICSTNSQTYLIFIDDQSACK